MIVIKNCLCGLFLVLLFASLNTADCAEVEPNYDSLLAALRGDSASGSAGDYFAAIREFHQAAEKSIPHLIGAIRCDTLRGISCGLHRSVLPECYSTACFDVLIPYLIELILGVDNLDSLSTGMGLDYWCVYQFGIICKSDAPCVEEEDMKEIKAIYEKWWEENKDKPIEELRKDWKEGKRPLTGSIYEWR